MTEAVRSQAEKPRSGSEEDAIGYLGRVSACLADCLAQRDLLAEAIRNHNSTVPGYDPGLARALVDPPSEIDALPAYLQARDVCADLAVTLLGMAQSYAEAFPDHEALVESMFLAPAEHQAA